MSVEEAAGLRVYPAKKWKGQALLVCGKCERKLKGSGSELKVKKVLKRLAKRELKPIDFQLIRVGCMDLCPRGGVAVCTQAGLGMMPPGLNILWSKWDVKELYERCRWDGPRPQGLKALVSLAHKTQG